MYNICISFLLWPMRKYRSYKALIAWPLGEKLFLSAFLNLFTIVVARYNKPTIEKLCIPTSLYALIPTLRKI